MYSREELEKSCAALGLYQYGYSYLGTGDVFVGYATPKLHHIDPSNISEPMRAGEGPLQVASSIIVIKSSQLASEETSLMPVVRSGCATDDVVRCVVILTRSIIQQTIEKLNMSVGSAAPRSLALCEAKTGRL